MNAEDQEFEDQLNALLVDITNSRSALTNHLTLLTELHADHATNRSAIVDNQTQINALVIDLAAQKVIIDELVDDHATVITELTAIGTTLADFKSIYDAHCHTADGNASRTSVPDSGTPTGSPSAASAFTDTSGSSVPATLTAAKTAVTGVATSSAPAATLTASVPAAATALTATAGT